MSNIEIEIQVQVEKVASLLKFLKSKGKDLGTSRQIDIYYTPAHKNYIAKKPVDEWLRLRDTDGIYSITYKNWHHDKDGKSRYCDEYETAVKDIKQIKLLFKALDVKETVKVDKNRSKYKYGKYEISIDKVKNLGSFVEIECKGDRDVKDAKKITDEMILFLKNLNVGKIYRNYVGYPFQILFPNEIELEEY
jgi:adenylate cyclase class 2